MERLHMTDLLEFFRCAAVVEISCVTDHSNEFPRFTSFRDFFINFKFHENTAKNLQTQKSRNSQREIARFFFHSLDPTTTMSASLWLGAETRVGHRVLVDRFEFANVMAGTQPNLSTKSAPGYTT